jgi:predicted esterase
MRDDLRAAALLATLYCAWGCDGKPTSANGVTGQQAAAGVTGTSGAGAGSAGGQAGSAGAKSGHSGAPGPSQAGAAGGGGTAVQPQAGTTSEEDAGTAEPGDAGLNDANAADGVPTPIPAPTTDDCITDASAGDHTFSCSGLTFLVLVPPQCIQQACGLIFDVHGGTMSGAQMRDNTHLHELAPKHDFIVVHPSATASNTGGSWDLSADPPLIAEFLSRMIKAFHVDADRVHVTGFSQGSAVTFYFLCNHAELLASAAPVSGSSADVTCINASWQPRVPILFMNGLTDQALAIEAARERVQGFVQELQLTGGSSIAGDGHYDRKHWEGPGGMVLDYIEHDYGGQAVLGGHCLPGGTDTPGGPNNNSLNATTCTTGDIKLNWGEVALQWFLDHPRKR